MAKYSAKLGIDLSEDTVVLLKSPGKMEVIGSNVVAIIYGSGNLLQYTQIKENQNICLQM